MGQSPGRLISWVVYFKESDSWHCYAHCFSEGAVFQVREQDGLHEVFVKGLGKAVFALNPNTYSFVLVLSMAENLVLYSSIPLQ